MILAAAQVADAVGGRVDGPDAVVSGASVDSRSVAAGQLFVPLVAARDGHRFIADALAAGAAAYLTAQVPVGGTAVVVDDTADALWTLGVYARSLLPDRVVGITGSVGKTTVKDLVAGGLAGSLRTHATHDSYNNELGVPLTLLCAPDGVEAVVVEMGARFPGDLTRLVELARPAVGVISRSGRPTWSIWVGRTGWRGKRTVDRRSAGDGIRRRA